MGVTNIRDMKKKKRKDFSFARYFTGSANKRGTALLTRIKKGNGPGILVWDSSRVGTYVWAINGPLKHLR